MTNDILFKFFFLLCLFNIFIALLTYNSRMYKHRGSFRNRRFLRPSHCQRGNSYKPNRYARTFVLPGIAYHPLFEGLSIKDYSRSKIQLSLMVFFSSSIVHNTLVKGSSPGTGFHSCLELLRKTSAKSPYGMYSNTIHGRPPGSEGKHSSVNYVKKVYDKVTF